MNIYAQYCVDFSSECTVKYALSSRFEHKSMCKIDLHWKEGKNKIDNGFNINDNDCCKVRIKHSFWERDLFTSYKIK